jgi:hypothetical protein
MLARVLLVLPAGLLLLTPFALLAVALVQQPDLLSILADRPQLTAKLALGLVVSVLFCTLPFSSLLDDGRSTRTHRPPLRASAPRTAAPEAREALHAAA